MPLSEVLHVNDATPPAAGQNETGCGGDLPLQPARLMFSP
jgi:hypothetical protein